MEGEKKTMVVSDVGAWAMNVVSSVGIIMANKQLMSTDGYAFSFATTLTGFHFAATALVGLVSNATSLSASKHVPMWELLWFSIVANMSITGMNLSLMLNSVGFYQSIGSLQKKYSIGSFELLSKTAPIQALSLLVLGPFVDYYLSGKFITTYKMSSGAIFFVLLSCCLAVFCNMSQYLCIGRFSAVSFQVLGHMKTVCVLTLGWLLFDSELTFKNIMGMILAVVGMVIYSWAVEVGKNTNTKNLPPMKNSLTEEDIKLLKAGVEDSSVKDIELGQSKE
ncbi:Nucleotide-sugar transporter family protein [Tripterygium wilfordii]|uniref:Nucleotide-sugar transporter family protein n=1 Tax=Tripterygium wilfordii TaxID=458696 RepID=A0A7J7D3S1_TRIWF|nr:Nucleotide-sugar transporter family protein [Tripterygium wilfordii]